MLIVFNNMKNLIQETIKKIETQHITPEPRWKHLVRKYGVWLFFMVVLVLGAASLSVAFHLSANLDWDLYNFMQQNRLIYFLSLLPYFWIVLIIIFFVIALFEIRRTETGYRYSRLKMFVIIICSILPLVIFMLFIGLGDKLNSTLSNGIPFYGRHMIITKESQWMRPEEGFLAGRIITASKNKLTITGLDKESWNIELDEKTSIKPSVNIASGEIIKIIGTKIGTNSFKAKEIRSWMGKGNGARNNTINNKTINGKNGRMMRGN